MAGSNYEVNIKLDIRQAKDQLKTLEDRITKLNRMALSGKASKQALAVDKEKIKVGNLELKQNQGILKIKQQELKLDKQQFALEKQKANFISGGKGKTGTGKTGGSSGVLSSAIISGAFPLLFGQGPLVGLAGALGGGIGSAVGGQMGGFAGGLFATSIVTPIQQFGIEAAKLGQALNSLNKDTTPLIESLGLVGSNFERQVKIIEQLGDKETAFALVREKMTQQIGKDGVDSLSRFGDQAQDLTTSFSVFMLNMRVGLANLIEQSGVLRALTRQIETDVAFGRALREAPNDSEVAKLLNKFQNVGKDRGLLGSFAQGFKDPQADKREKDKILDEITTLFKKRDTEKEIKAINDAVNKAAQKKLNTEITLLEKSKEKGHLSELEFEIQQKIQELKDKDIEIDEEALANKMRKLDALQKERQLALETAAAFEKMSQTIATDIADGIQGMIRGTSTLNDVLSNVLNKLIDASFNMAFFGNMQGSLGGGGLFGSVLGGLGGNKNKNNGILNSPVNPFFFMAEGGPVKRGGNFIVGERGPELFTPGVTGTVTPNHALGGSTTVVVNVDASGSSVEGDEQGGRELGRVISAAVQSELIQQKRPGGLLA